MVGGGGLASGSRDGTLRLFTMQEESGDELRVIHVKGFGRALAWSPCGGVLAEAGPAPNILMHDMRGRQDEVNRRLLDHHDKVTSVAFSKHGRFLASVSLELWVDERG